MKYNTFKITLKITTTLRSPMAIYEYLKLLFIKASRVMSADEWKIVKIKSKRKKK